MMPCGFDRNQLRAWATGTLPDRQAAAAIAAHVKSCPACSSAVEATRTCLASGPTPAPGVPQPLPLLSEQIGQYRILRKLGEGGMGVVFEAEQQVPRRRVALKVIRDSRLADSLRIRLFRREMETLARLNHPGIAAIYDAGLTPDGHYYFAMELVDGVELNRIELGPAGTILSLASRLRLFQRICQAVLHAHQRGVIHRDLKPTNILVDGQGNPKVLDFGLARVTAGDDSGVTVLSEPGRLLGTLAYMSPEQARGEAAAVDVRTDVYALGVILYEMLLGRAPYEVQGLPLHESLRTICEQPPVHPRTVDGSLPADMATILLKTLEKDPQRRYPDAGALVDDIECFLTRRPIRARPPSVWYQTGLFARRNKVWMGAAMAVVLAVVGGLVGTGAALSRALRAEGLARQRLVDVERARQAEARERRVAEDEAATAEAVVEFLANMLAAVNPAQGARDITVREVLDRTAADIGQAFPGRPRVEATVRDTMGRSYLSLAAYEQADEQLTRALALQEETLGSEHLQTLETLNDLATLRQSQGRLEEAEQLFRRQVDARSRVSGDKDPNTLTALNNLALLLVMLGRLEEAEPLLRRALTGQQALAGLENLATLDAMNNLATVLQYQGKLDAAERLSRQALAVRRKVFGDRHPGTLTAISNLGTLLATKGNLAEAEPLYYESLALSRAVLGDEHPETLMSLANVAGLLRDEKRFAEAERLYREALQARRRVLGDTHQDTLENLQNLGLVLRDQDRFAEAEPILQEAYDASRRTLGEDHPDAIAAEYALGLVRMDAGRPVEAEPLLRDAAARAEHGQGESPWKTHLYRSMYGHCLAKLDRYAEAEPLLLEGQRVLNETFDETDERTQAVVRWLVQLYDAWGRPDQAARWREQLSIGDRQNDPLD